MEPWASHNVALSSRSACPVIGGLPRQSVRNMDGTCIGIPGNYHHRGDRIIYLEPNSHFWAVKPAKRIPSTRKIAASGPEFPYSAPPNRAAKRQNSGFRAKAASSRMAIFAACFASSSHAEASTWLQTKAIARYHPSTGFQHKCQHPPTFALRKGYALQVEQN